MIITFGDFLKEWQDGSWVIVVSDAELLSNTSKSPSIILRQSGGMLRRAAEHSKDLARLLKLHLCKNGNIPAVFSQFRLITLPARCLQDDAVSVDLLRKSCMRLIPMLTEHQISRAYLSFSGDDEDELLTTVLSGLLDDRFTLFSLSNAEASRRENISNGDVETSDNLKQRIIRHVKFHGGTIVELLQEKLT